MRIFSKTGHDQEKQEEKDILQFGTYYTGLNSGSLCVSIAINNGHCQLSVNLFTLSSYSVIVHVNKLHVFQHTCAVGITSKLSSDVSCFTMPCQEAVHILQVL